MKVLKFFNNIEPSERYFLFTDGSYKSQLPEEIGVGAELRNKDGNVVFVYSERINVNTLEKGVFPTDCEKVALRNSLNICIEKGVKLIVVNTDASGLSSKIGQYVEALEINQEKREELRNTDCSINNQMYDCVEMFDEFFITHIPRDLNYRADFYSRTTEEIIKYGIEKKIEMPCFFEMQEKINKVKGVEKNDSKVKIGCKSHSSSKLNNSIKILDLSKYTLSSNEKRDDKMMMIDISDNTRNNRFIIRVFFNKDGVRSTNEFQFIHIDYNQLNKKTILLFIVYNLITQSSSINLLKEQDKTSKIFNYSYNDEDWFSFDNLSIPKKYFKTYIHMSDSLWKNWKSAIFMNHLNLKNLLDQDCFAAFYKTIYNANAEYFVGRTQNQAFLYVDEDKIKEANEKNHLKNLREAEEMKAIF